MTLLVPLLQVWDTHTGEELHTLEGHKNVVGCDISRHSADMTR